MTFHNWDSSQLSNNWTQFKEQHFFFLLVGCKLKCTQMAEIWWYFPRGNFGLNMLLWILGIEQNIWLKGCPAIPNGNSWQLVLMRTRSSTFTTAVVNLIVKFNKLGKDKRSFLNIKYNIHTEINSLHFKSNTYTSNFQPTFKRI